MAIDLPENELALRAQAGDTEAEAELMRLYEPQIRYSVRAYRGHADYDDAMQDAAMGAMRGWRSFRPGESTLGGRICAYAHGYARNFGGKLVTAESKEVDDTVVEDPSPTPDVTTERNDLQRAIADLVNACPTMDAADRVIFFRRILPDDGLTAKEVARLVGMNMHAVYYRERRLKERILPRLLRRFQSEVTG